MYVCREEAVASRPTLETFRNDALRRQQLERLIPHSKGHGAIVYAHSKDYDTEEIWSLRFIKIIVHGPSHRNPPVQCINVSEGKTVTRLLRYPATLASTMPACRHE